MSELWPGDRRPTSAISLLDDSEESVDDVVDLGGDRVVSALEVAPGGLFGIFDVMGDVVHHVVGVSSKALEVMLDLAVGACCFVAGLGGGVGKL